MQQVENGRVAPWDEKESRAWERDGVRSEIIFSES